MPDDPHPALPCKRFLEAYSAWRDAADPALVAEMDDHLVVCPSCREHEAAIRRGIGVLHGDVLEPSPEFERTLYARLEALERRALMFRAPSVAPTAAGALLILLLCWTIVRLHRPGVSAASAQTDPPAIAQPVARPGVPFVAFLPPPGDPPHPL